MLRQKARATPRLVLHHVAVKSTLKCGPVKTVPTILVAPALFILGEQDEKNFSTFSNHFLIIIFNITFKIAVFIHVLGFKKYVNPCVVVLSCKPLKYGGDADLPIMIGGSLTLPTLTKNESPWPFYHPDTPFSCLLGFYLELLDKNTPVSSVFRTSCV